MQPVKITSGIKQRYTTKVVLCQKKEAFRYPDFEGTKDSSTILYKNSIPTIIVGLGSHRDLFPEALRRAAHTACTKAKSIKKTDISIQVPELKGFSPDTIVSAMTEGIVLGCYTFDQYKKKDKKTGVLKNVQFVTKHRVGPVIKKVHIICDAVNYARDLVNDSAHVMTPQRIADEALKLAGQPDVNVTVFNEKDIHDMGMGLFEAVGMGAQHPPRLTLIEYNGAPESNKRYALVGKGITFDSGGINIKGSGHIETMRTDMAGTAAVLGVCKAASTLRLPVNLIGALATAENAAGSRSYYPGDIYTSYSGKTVQIANTDAEGRLVLADTLAYVVKNFKPHIVIDLATLTGAIVVCFANVAAGLFSNNRRLANQLHKAGERTFERLWELPLYDEFREAMKGDISDLSNLSNLGRSNAGSSTAAAFLEAFVDKTQWAHIDIAGTAFNEKNPAPYIPKHASGFGVRLLVDWLTHL